MVRRSVFLGWSCGLVHNESYSEEGPLEEELARAQVSALTSRPYASRRDVAEHSTKPKTQLQRIERSRDDCLLRSTPTGAAAWRPAILQRLAKPRSSLQRLATICNTGPSALAGCISACPSLSIRYPLYIRITPAGVASTVPTAAKDASNDVATIITMHTIV
jgi:hypothetical protein